MVYKNKAFMQNIINSNKLNDYCKHVIFLQFKIQPIVIKFELFSFFSMILFLTIVWFSRAHIPIGFEFIYSNKWNEASFENKVLFISSSLFKFWLNQRQYSKRLAKSQRKILLYSFHFQTAFSFFITYILLKIF